MAEYPAKLSYEEGTSIWMQYITAYGALVHYGHLGKDDFVVVTAASSSVGLAAIEIVKAEGAISIATTRTSAKKAELLSFGPDHVIATEEEDLVARVNEITANKGARIVFDPSAVKAFWHSPKLPQSKAPYSSTVRSPPNPPHILSSLHSASVSSSRAIPLRDILANPVSSQEARKYVLDHIAAGHFKPRIDKVFPFAQIVEAHRYMELNAQIGKIVLTLGS